MQEGTGPRTGTRFGPYELRSLLGKGGMGEVYEAYDTVKDRMVAVKLLPDEFAQDPIYQVRFRRESQAAARLADPHVIPIHDWGVIDGVLFIDMRLVRGVDLRTLLRSQGPLSPARAVGIIEQIAAALDAAHRADLVHRDVKPANILVTDADFAYLADFGIAHTEGDSAVTLVGMAIGSYIYMAPERFDTGPVTGRADVYSLACVLHECLTGATPFPSASMSVLIKAHLTDPPPRPSAGADGIPPALDEVVIRGMAKDPADRFPTATALARAARAALTPVSPAEPTLVVRAPDRPPTSGGPVVRGAAVAAESTGELSIPAVIRPSEATVVRPTETQFTPLQPANEPEGPRPSQPSAAGLPPMRPFPDAHLYPETQAYLDSAAARAQGYPAPAYPQNYTDSAAPTYAPDHGYPPGPVGYQVPRSGYPVQEHEQYDGYPARSGYPEYGHPEYGYDEMPPPPSRTGRSIALPIMVAVLAIVALTVGGAIVWQTFGSGSAETTSAEPMSEGAVPTTRPRLRTMPPAGSPTTPDAPPPVEPPAVTLPVGATPCGQGGAAAGGFSRSAAGTTVTSCPFAEAVRRAYADSAEPPNTAGNAPRTVVATSPVTGQTYTMKCRTEDQLVICTGGNNAVVYVY
ncbi:protein kinase domain-containing protein [Nocardia sp. 004]|uniref:protein kinase domain-containing protein n=1 Tax=Nocardia sp. 004 TaxID=3385978 RepID=UPI0039A23CBB